jgi:hypothetical protein
MKKITLSGFLLIALMVICTSVYAQKKTMATAEERAGKITEWMKTNLQLKDDQVAQVNNINLKYANKMDEIMNGPGEKKDKKMKAKEEAEAKDAELKAVLDESQYQTYQAKKEEMKKQVKEKS